VKLRRSRIGDDSIRGWCKLYEEHRQAGLAVVGHDDSDSHLTPRQEAELVEWVRAKAPAPCAERFQACVHYLMNRVMNTESTRPGAGALPSQFFEPNLLREILIDKRTKLLH
jgi:hypothetical protein